MRPRCLQVARGEGGPRLNPRALPEPPALGAKVPGGVFVCPPCLKRCVASGGGGATSGGGQRLAVGSVLAGSCPGIAGATLAAACHRLPPERKLPGCWCPDVMEVAPFPGHGQSRESHFPAGGAGVCPLGGQSSLQQRLHGLPFGSVGSDFQAEFLDENKKGEQKNKKK